jgi:hypothetical protein
VHGLLCIHLRSYDFGIFDEWGECFKKIWIWGCSPISIEWWQNNLKNVTPKSN